MNIGDLLRAFGVIDDATLQKACDAQRLLWPDKRLGDVLVALRLASRQQVEDVAAKQATLRERPGALSPKDTARVVDYVAEAQDAMAQRLLGDTED